jgi:uroporphyrinogen-III synthase
MIFVTRSLAPDSPLRSWAAEHNHQVQAQSLIRFAALPFTAPAMADWWFYYSSRAVRFAGLPPPGVRLAALGRSTAAAVKERSGRVDFHGDGQPEQVALDFLKVADGQAVFFPRARQSRLTVQSALSEHITVLDAVCYDNQPAPPAAEIPAEVYIFTSPLNVAAYLDHFSLPPNVRVLAMGPSTAGELARRGIASEWPPVAGEAGLVKLLA